VDALDAMHSPYSGGVPDAAPQSRTLIFGGTFDPPHCAHVALPQAAARELGCDRILYIPAAVSPFKAAPDFPPPTAAQHRLAMLRLALRDSPNAEISTFEIDRAAEQANRAAAPSYTIDTLRGLRAEAAARGEWFLLIGADQALDFHRWKNWREILERATPAVMLRPPWQRQTFVSALRERYDPAEAQHWEGWTLRSLPQMDVSATVIRSRLAAGLPLDGLVHPDVEAYIRDKGLYGDAPTPS
jgi:nicotinate-nucleotide adenylyltransferase